MWEPATILVNDSPTFIYSLIVLNQPIDPVLYSDLSAFAVDVVCADGGANRVYDMTSLHSLEDRAPGFICGDMDSVRPEVEEAFASVGTKVVKDRDLYATDFIKSLRVVNDEVKLKYSRARKSKYSRKRYRDEQERRELAFEKGGINVIVLGGLGGRADQAFSQLHHLYAASIDPTLDRIGRIYLVTEESIIFLLEKGFNRIETPVGAGQLGKDVGIIPLGGPSIITTHGLNWDVTDWKTSFGSQISTSNWIRGSHVEVITTERVLFTVHIAGATKPAKESSSDSISLEEAVK